MKVPISNQASICTAMELSAPPRALDVQHFAKARATELASLYAALRSKRAHEQTGEDAAVPRHLRRRTTSHSRRKSLAWLYKKKRKAEPSVELENQPEKKKRRRRKGKRKKADSKYLEDTSKKPRLCRRLRRQRELKGGRFGVSGDGTRRLATHVWHAKRFSMAKLWGCFIPVGRAGRGRGSRAVLRWARDSALIHDASFYAAIQLSGPQDGLLKALHLVLEPSYYLQLRCESVQSQLSGTCFSRAMLHRMGKTIAPVILVWRPLVSEARSLLEVDASAERHLWIWIHPAAFDDAYQALKTVCSELNELSGETLVSCCSRRGDLARIDILGLKSLQLLQKVLHPVSSSGKIPQFLQTDYEVPDGAVIALHVSDPRIKAEKSLPKMSVSLQGVSEAAIDESDCKGDSKAHNSSYGVDAFIKGEFPHQESIGEWEWQEDHVMYVDVKDCNSCWVALCGDGEVSVKSPTSEKNLSDIRHLQRLGSFSLQKVGTNVLFSTQHSKGCSNFESALCPVVLLRHLSEIPSACGWSIIMPSNWIWPFWVPLVFAGGRVIGLRERHWLSTDAGIPFFPNDFPDSASYASMNDEPEGLTDLLPERVLVSSQSLNAPGGCLSCRFVARSLTALRSFLQQCKQTHLLLFPKTVEQQGKIQSLNQGLKEGTIAWRAYTPNQKLEYEQIKESCFLRVIVHTPQKGTLKKWANIYAPTTEDFNFWLCNRRKFKLIFDIKTLQRSQPLGEGSESLTTNGPIGMRKPIGFVTSAAVRGSHHNAAIAFCDAISLGQIRAKQWLDPRWQNIFEFFLLAHNERSNVYMPVLASIALENGADI